MTQYGVFMVCLLFAFGATSAGASIPLDDPQIRWVAGPDSQTAQGRVQSWHFQSDLAAHDLARRLTPACGVFQRALRVDRQWVLQASTDDKGCVLWLDQLSEGGLSGALTRLQPSALPQPVVVPPVSGSVLWQHALAGNEQLWLIQVQENWRGQLRAQGWQPESSERRWEKGQAMLELVPVRHQQADYLLLKCAQCRGYLP